MGVLWDLYWPVLTAAVIVGLVAGWLLFRSRKALLAGEKADMPDGPRRRNLILPAAIASSIAIGAVWHFAGAGDRLATDVEAAARSELVRLEMGSVGALIERDPLRRELALAGPADDFQRSELSRIMAEVPGVAEAHWGGDRSALPLPLMVEACLLSLAGFLLGLLLAYLVELRRRANAGWRW